jgi:glutathione S-transferase
MWVRIIEYNGLAAVADMLRNSSEHFADRGLTGAAGGIPQIPALVERGRATLERFFDRLEDQLAQNQYIAGKQFLSGRYHGTGRDRLRALGEAAAAG